MFNTKGRNTKSSRHRYKFSVSLPPTVPSWATYKTLTYTVTNTTITSAFIYADKKRTRDLSNYTLSVDAFKLL